MLRIRVPMDAPMSHPPFAGAHSVVRLRRSINHSSMLCVGSRKGSYRQPGDGDGAHQCAAHAAGGPAGAPGPGHAGPLLHICPQGVWTYLEPAMYSCRNVESHWAVKYPGLKNESVRMESFHQEEYGSGDQMCGDL